jgi:bacteriocin-like protein
MKKLSKDEMKQINGGGQDICRAACWEQHMECGLTIDCAEQYTYCLLGCR